MNSDNFEPIFGDYEHFCDEIKNEFIAGLEEGIKDGTKEGVKNGILNALSECSTLGFLQIEKTEIKSIGQILKDNAAENVEEQTGKIVQEKICPILRKNLKNVCEITVNQIKKRNSKINAKLIEAWKNIDINRIFEDKIQKLQDQIKGKLPQNFIFCAIYEGVQKSSRECLDQEIKTCEKRIQDLLKTKNIDYEEKNRG